MNTNKEINPVLKSRLRERFFIFIVNNFSAGFLNMETKICNKCKLEKTINDFSKNKIAKDGLQNKCKECSNDALLIWRKNNPDYDRNYYRKNIEYRIKEYHIEYAKKNRKKTNKRWRKWSQKNYDKVKEDRRIYYNKNINKIRKYMREWQKNKCYNDPIYKLNKNIRHAIWFSLKGNKNGRHWEKIVGYDTMQLKKHLEAQFKKGMTWDNYGRNGWHVDHIIPLSIFNIKGIKSKGFKKCWALENLQPLWEKDNAKKKNILFY